MAKDQPLAGSIESVRTFPADTAHDLNNGKKFSKKRSADGSEYSGRHVPTEKTRDICALSMARHDVYLLVSDGAPIFLNLRKNVLGSKDSGSHWRWSADGKSIVARSPRYRRHLMPSAFVNDFLGTTIAFTKTEPNLF